MGHSAAPAVSLSFAQTQPHVAGINELGAAVSLRIARHQRSDLLGGPVAAQGLQELRCLPVVLLLLLGILRILRCSVASGTSSIAASSCRCSTSGNLRFLHLRKSRLRGIPPTGHPTTRSHRLRTPTPTPCPGNERRFRTHSDICPRSVLVS